MLKGGTVHNRTYGQVPDVQWKRNIPATMNARIILNDALRNADWAGGPAEDSQTPSAMLVDYVRVYDTRANATNKESKRRSRGFNETA